MTNAASTFAPPLYRQVADRLRAEVARLAARARLPSEPELAREWGVSRFTITKAVTQLVQEGLITRKQGSGTFVADAPLRRISGSLLSFAEATGAAGHRGTHQVLVFGATAWHAGLPYARDSGLVALDRLRLVDGRPVARHLSVLPAEIVARTGLRRPQLENPFFSLYRFYEQHGIHIHSATERLVARAASAQEQRLLDLKRNAIVVCVTRHSFSSDGQPIDAVDAVYDARRYSYEARLTRETLLPTP